MLLIRPTRLTFEVASGEAAEEGRLMHVLHRCRVWRHDWQR